MSSVSTITLWQPWASLIRPERGFKHIETRSWPTNYRGPLAIHAAKRAMTEDEIQMIHREPFFDAICNMGDEGENLQFGMELQPERITPHCEKLNACFPLGVVVSVALLVDCVQVPDGPPFQVWTTEFPEVISIPPPYPEREFGDYTPGRYAWVLSDITPLSFPVAAEGKLGLWQCDARPVVGAAERLRRVWLARHPKQEALF